MIAALLLLWTVAQAALGDVTAPTYAVGDAFVYSNGRIERVRAVAGDEVTWSGLSGDPWRRSRNFVVPTPNWRLQGQEGRRTVFGQPERLWPLRPGRIVEFRIVTESRNESDPPNQWRRSLLLWSCQIGRIQAVHVAAGDFNTMPIVCDRFSVGTMRLIERTTWDYSPDIGHYVRRTTVTYANAQTQTLELVAALHGRAATNARLAALARPYQQRRTPA